MTNEKKIIVLVESSAIIFEGLSNILFRTGKYTKILKADSLSEIDGFDKINSDYLFIVNPIHVYNVKREFINIKKKFNRAKWIALTYNIVDKDILSLFDGTIYINDNDYEILNVISKNISEYNELNLVRESLTEREVEVLKLVTYGFSNKEIADQLFISTNTVITHRQNITKKTNIKSQSGLTIYALSNNIIKIEDYSLHKKK